MQPGLGRKRDQKRLDGELEELQRLRDQGEITIEQWRTARMEMLARYDKGTSSLRSGGWWKWIGTVAITILALAWFGYGLAGTWTDVRLATSGETTAGTLLSDASGGAQTGYGATVAFTTSDGQLVETWIPTSAFDAKGDVIDVHYDPADPTNVTAAGIGGILLGSLLLLFPLGGAVAGLWLVVEDRPWGRNR